MSFSSVEIHPRSSRIYCLHLHSRSQVFFIVTTVRISNSTTYTCFWIRIILIVTILDMYVIISTRFTDSEFWLVSQSVTIVDSLYQFPTVQWPRPTRWDHLPLTPDDENGFSFRNIVYVKYNPHIDQYSIRIRWTNNKIKGPLPISLYSSWLIFVNEGYLSNILIKMQRLAFGFRGSHFPLVHRHFPGFVWNDTPCSTKLWNGCDGLTDQIYNSSGTLLLPFIHEAENRCESETYASALHSEQNRRWNVISDEPPGSAPQHKRQLSSNINLRSIMTSCTTCKLIIKVCRVVNYPLPLLAPLATSFRFLCVCVCVCVCVCDVFPR
jgi:hypothetical protein